MKRPGVDFTFTEPSGNRARIALEGFRPSEGHLDLTQQDLPVFLKRVK
jgi:hypothetical protein